MRECDVLVIGGGVLGLSVAYAALRREPRSRVIVLEKEGEVAAHASGRNSGVLHAGIYYGSSSLKARFCLEGNREWKQFCRERNIPVLECGKLIIATCEEERPRLHDLYERAVSNGTPVEWLTQRQAEEKEPNAAAVGEALWSPETASVDPVIACQALAGEIQALGGEICFHAAYQGREGDNIRTSQGVFKASLVVNCAGLYADRIAHDYGFGADYTLLPFKGLYLKYGKNKTDLRTHLYPVPDPAFPFLGVHFTKTVDGGIKIGPTAIPALWREQYSWTEGFSSRELVEVVRHEGDLFLRNSFHFRDLAMVEMKRYFRRVFIAEAKRLVKSLDENGFTHFTRPGIRAQLLNKKTRELVQDFVVEGDAKSVHVLNAVSPGFTAALPFARHILERQ